MAIDSQLALRTPYAELERLYRIPYRSFSKHDKNHLDYQSAVIRRIIDGQAEAANQNIEFAVLGSAMRRAALDVGIKRGFDRIVTGEAEIKPGDLTRMVEVREKIETEVLEAQLADAVRERELFITATKQVCDVETLGKIKSLVGQD